MWLEIKKILNQYENFIITTHIHPDGDGIGAASVLIELLLHMKKNVRFICDSPIPKKFLFLDDNHCFETYDENSSYADCQVLIVLDTHKKNRIGRLACLIDRPGIVSICIDHHLETETFTPYAVIDEKACSAGAMIYDLCKEFGFSLNFRSARGVYASVICDTGRFSYSSVDQKAHKIADECIKAGVDPDLMHAQLFQNVSLAEIRMFAQALQGIETFLDNRVVVEQIKKEDCESMTEGSIDLENADLDYIHDFNNLIKDVRCFILLRELSGGHVRVSLRAKGDIDITPIVRSLGGGGHTNAAGVTIKGSLEEVKKMILKLLSDYFETLESSLVQI